MASIFSHVAIPIALRIGSGAAKIPSRLFTLGLLLSILPDADTIGFLFGIPYDSQWGHRGFSHSLFAAALVATGFAWIVNFSSTRRWMVFLFLFISMASHGALDACTTGGHGVAFFWPLTSQRYFLPWQVIKVSPIGAAPFFTRRGLAVLQSELFWIWLPSLTAALVLFSIRKFSMRRT